MWAEQRARQVGRQLALVPGMDLVGSSRILCAPPCLTWILVNWGWTEWTSGEILEQVCASPLPTLVHECLDTISCGHWLRTTGFWSCLWLWPPGSWHGFVSYKTMILLTWIKFTMNISLLLGQKEMLLYPNTSVRWWFLESFKTVILSHGKQSSPLTSQFCWETTSSLLSNTFWSLLEKLGGP